ncbi:hypothetical protein [Humisphaera borealis]|uniref:Uncharacterized protein n=1 Tax=Humisphaera borealis TaxID=2807512 RepID=A0A7M2WXL3_9BACT|nr:hypothetical protein [Humisphaera borealis]QOV90267.1 hypothetical protein IPV69_02520 [Humisphaera borealis]
MAEQIRAVRQAQRRFMGRWRLEQVIIGPELLDHLADDMAAAHLELESSDHSAENAPAETATQTSHRDGWGYPRSRIWSM